MKAGKKQFSYRKYIYIYFFTKYDNSNIVLMDKLTKFNFLGPDEQGTVFIIYHNIGTI